MKKSVDHIVWNLKSRISEKYDVREMRLFGSSVRGDRRSDSDIDVFIILPKVNRQIEEDLYDIAYELELKYDCLIDLIVFSDEILEDHYFHVPIYQNILKEGTII